MGADIHSIAEYKKEGDWILSDKEIFSNGKKTSPFDWRSYGMFGFLANVRNMSNVPVIKSPVGLPSDSLHLNKMHDDMWGDGSLREDITSGGYHSYSYLLLSELLDYDYGVIFIDVRGTPKRTTIRDFLGPAFFKEIDQLDTLGDPEEVRVIYWFDN